MVSIVLVHFPRKAIDSGGSAAIVNGFRGNGLHLHGAWSVIKGNKEEGKEGAAAARFMSRGNAVRGACNAAYHTPR